MPSPLSHRAALTALAADLRDGPFLIAVRVDGSRSRVERFAGFDAMMEAARQYLWNDAIAWVSLNDRERRRVRQTHLVVRRGEEIIVTEQAGRLERVRRATKSRPQGTADLG